jgi:predicted RNA-binding protein YlxR (DUF448 family)
MRQERTCIACRRKGPKAGFARLVSEAGSVRLDPGFRLPGRGAYICRDMGCVNKALKDKGVFARAFKKDVNMADGAGLMALVQNT